MKRVNKMNRNCFQIIFIVLTISLWSVYGCDDIEPERHVSTCRMIRNVSEENGGMGLCPSGSLLSGIICHGSYCDNKDLKCCTYKDNEDNDRIISWSPWFSEESTGYGTAQGFIGGIQCSGKYCDNIRLQFITSKHIRNVGSWYTTGWFSEEGPYNFGYCAENEFIDSLSCSGRYCDNINVLCARAAGPGDPEYKPEEWMGNRWP